jgi:hypothetical protein
MDNYLIMIQCNEANRHGHGGELQIRISTKVGLYNELLSNFINMISNGDNDFKTVSWAPILLINFTNLFQKQHYLGISNFFGEIQT